MKQGSKASPLWWERGGRNGRVSKGDFVFGLFCGRREISELITSLVMVTPMNW
jgi:hypothetical protein